MKTYIVAALLVLAAVASAVPYYGSYGFLGGVGYGYGGPAYYKAISPAYRTYSVPAYHSYGYAAPYYKSYAPAISYARYLVN